MSPFCVVHLRIFGSSMNSLMGRVTITPLHVAFDLPYHSRRLNRCLPDKLGEFLLRPYWHPGWEILHPVLDLRDRSVNASIVCLPTWQCAFHTRSCFFHRFFDREIEIAALERVVHRITDLTERSSVALLVWCRTYSVGFHRRPCAINTGLSFLDKRSCWRVSRTNNDRRPRPEHFEEWRNRPRPDEIRAMSKGTTRKRQLFTSIKSMSPVLSVPQWTVKLCFCNNRLPTGRRSTSLPF